MCTEPIRARPHPPTVIPAKAGIQVVGHLRAQRQSALPSVIPAQAGIRAVGCLRAQRQPTPPSVIPAQAGIQCNRLIGFNCNQSHDLDSRLRGNDGNRGDSHTHTHTRPLPRTHPPHACLPQAQAHRRKDGAKGFTLVEAVLFMVVVSVALTLVLKAFDVAGSGSADPLLRRQSLAIAQALVEEIQAKPFGDAASDDPAQGGFAGPYTAANRSRFDDVDDYAGLSLPGITTLANVALDGLSAYSASVAVDPAAFGAVPAGAGYRISVTVTDPANRSLTLQAYRANY